MGENPREISGRACLFGVISKSTTRSIVEQKNPDEKRLRRDTERAPTAVSW